MNRKEIIPSVNFHLWQACNMSCKYCFARFEDIKTSSKAYLSKEESIQLVEKLCSYLNKYSPMSKPPKITFVGGEPTLCPWLYELVSIAKKRGLTTMIVTNGSRLDDSFLKKYEAVLDWIGLSIDSLNEQTNQYIGRSKGQSTTIDYFKLLNQLKKYDYKLKINTVVSRFNLTEDFSSFIKLVQPQRWKVFQVLKIKGQNDQEFDQYKISKEEFNTFVEKHKSIQELCQEDNEAMTGSYLMISPNGCFFDNSTGEQQYSFPILKVGITEALNQISYDLHKANARGGDYDW